MNNLNNLKDILSKPRSHTVKLSTNPKLIVEGLLNIPLNAILKTYYPILDIINIDFDVIKYQFDKLNQYLITEIDGLFNIENLYFDGKYKIYLVQNVLIIVRLGDFEILKQNDYTFISECDSTVPSSIRIRQWRGLWTIIAKAYIKCKSKNIPIALYLLEHNDLGDESPYLVVDASFNVICTTHNSIEIALEDSGYLIIKGEQL